MEAYTPIKGKCRWWREQANEEDRHDTTVPKERKRVMCMCWVEGDVWYVTNATVPAECPTRFHCRYYVKSA
jgi:hypothetical protein